MSMRKYTQSEKLEVLRGEEAQTLHEHRQRLGKSSLTDFTKDELEALEKELTSLSKREKSSDQSNSEKKEDV